MLSKSSVGTVGENGVGVSESMMLAFAEQLEANEGWRSRSEFVLKPTSSTDHSTLL
jgi:hypothetical protein